MTDKIALILGATIFGALLLDLVLNGGGAILFLGRKFVILLEYVAFWR
ncbi:hypothetical protein [uncultured Roseovarius sp.]|nr:hypothetical protein [uncultured Roseovarius sp.]